MTPLALGLTLALVGIGGTLLVLAGFAILAMLLKWLFPLGAEVPAGPTSGKDS